MNQRFENADFICRRLKIMVQHDILGHLATSSVAQWHINLSLSGPMGHAEFFL